ncbi:extracellular solute-binding protein [Paenibacillus urinalis]|uniref:Extracellular solute-binding protein n=1 Tax=Paenibacillus urinalis TaxID=521520 RepID=A0ABY7X687_9BACL|nr:MULTISPECIES: extracellular solute-binding protein [Paenibacillus]WDH96503.1 extracellular solute-binding protein [Paenibacillus urinalis]WDI00147.1 extracellular solute-binding protein [Paenibacillus urinalis]GAK40643.1 sugar ABC transporter sugar-binding protein [Paenibacillus sp. TCA20]
MKKWSIVLSLCLLISVIAAGCGGGSGTSGNNEDSEKVSITIWHNWTGQDAKAVAMRGIIEQFRSDHPNIEVIDEGLPSDGLRTRLRTVAAADEMPDLFVMWPDAMTKEFVKGDLLQPINEELDQNPEWKDKFIPNALEGYTVDGNIYSVPMNLAPSSFIYYNEALFKEHGVKVPTTWAELESAIQTFNEKDVIPIALGNKANWVVQSTLFSTLADRITGTEWFLSAIEQSGAKFTDPEFVEALNVLKKLGDSGAFQDGFNSIDETQMMQLYFQGKAAMVINGGWALANLVNNAPEEVLNHTHITILPPIEGGKGQEQVTAGVVGTGLGVSKKLTGERKEAAMELFYELAGPDGQKATLESSTLVSYDVELDRSKAHPLFVELYELMQDVKITPVYDSKFGSAATEVVDNSLQELLMNGNPEEVARKIQDAQAAAVGK